MEASLVEVPPDRIRNFCIVAHIDHGKSTLADRFLERAGLIQPGSAPEQVLDDMDLERERGITIKAHAVTLDYRAGDGQIYRLNLIDTPGHVDFTYEVSRSLAAAEGAILLVDATQGIEAQTVANLYLAVENGLEVIPVLNKVDRRPPELDRVRRELAELVGVAPEEVLLVSARLGWGVDELLERVLSRIPPPPDRRAAPLRALIFDSQYDPYRGVICLVRVVDGCLRAGQRVRLAGSGGRYVVQEVGHLRLRMEPREELSSGEVGYLVAGIKNVADAQVGDTVVADVEPAPPPLPGYQPMKPMVWCGLYPVHNDDYLALKDALAKLRLNDAALVFEPESSTALGFGFRCGFLGPLHVEIVQERLRREFGLELVATTPNVAVRVREKGQDSYVTVEHPGKMPPPSRRYEVEEPYVLAHIYTPPEFLGPVLKLLQERRGEQRSMEFLGSQRVRLAYLLPFSEIALNFYDRLKSASRGYATLDYEFHGWRPSDLVRLDIRLNGEPVDALSLIVHRDKAYATGRELVDRLRELIPRQLFPVAIQAAVGSKVIARANLPALRKDVLAKCYGGDVTRKRKLLERQKEGKKRMKQVGSVQVPQEAFLALLRPKEE
jgi:GTP-binding protein LepA